MRISIITPCWRELPAARAFAERWADTPDTEVILGLTRDDTGLAAFQQIGGVRASVSERAGRGTQMNDAARLATGGVLLFHHIDSHLTPEHLAALRRAMEDGGRVGGAFHRKFDERHPWLRCLEPLERLHGRVFGTLYGDQSIFVSRTVFEALGGYADFPIMEDVEFSRRLRRAGPIALLDPPMETSPRRHLERGPWRTTLTNVMLLVLYRLGMPPATLHRWYYSHSESINLPQEPARQLANERTHP